MALYLFGFFERRKRQQLYVVPRKRNFPWRYAGALVALCFGLYLLPGLFSSDRYFPALISGFAPPASYSVYADKTIKERSVVPKVVNDFDRAVELSRLEGKPILIDFTGWAFVNCRKMEEQVWTEPGVKSLLEEKYILLSLYVDDRKKLPAAKQFTYTTQRGIKKEVRTEGDQWSLFQSENFGQVTQPLYVIVSAEGSLLNTPLGYTSDRSKYAAWLRCGLNSYAEQKPVAKL
jgi:thiol:disulfide interchange protein DsbD